MRSDIAIADQTGLPLQNPLPRGGIFFPLGFPVRIESNRDEVLELAQCSWGTFRKRYSHEPLVIRLEVIHEDTRFIGHKPVSRIDGDLLTTIFNEQNFVVADLASGVALGKITSALLRADSYVRYYILETAAFSMISTTRAVALHAACVEWGGSGVMLCGESGAGKTSLAYACAREGWGYLSDDASYLLLDSDSREVTGNCYQVRFRDAAAALFPELRGHAITSRVSGKPSIEVETKELRMVHRIESAEVEYILFLNRDSNAAPGLYPVTPEKGREYFTKFLLRPSPVGSYTRAALDRLLGAQIFELRYARLDWAIDCMRAMVEADGDAKRA